MDQKYQFPLYGIDIPDNLIHNQTNTYDIYAERCENLNRCVRNPHYTIPKKRCSSDGGILLPHYTIYDKKTNRVNRTYYFPERIDNDRICSNMFNYTSKIERIVKHRDCNSNNICRVTISQSDIPEIFDEINDIIKQLEKVFDLLKKYCESSNIEENKSIEQTINSLVRLFDEHRQNNLYRLCDEHLHITPLKTKLYMEGVSSSLIFIPKTYKSKIEYRDLIKSFLQHEYNFLSNFLGFFIKNNVSVRDELAKIDSIRECAEISSVPKKLVSRGQFDVLKTDSPKSSEVEPEELPISEPSDVTSKKKLVKQRSQTPDDDEGLLKAEITRKHTGVINRLIEISQLNINYDFVLEYLNFESQEEHADSQPITEKFPIEYLVDICYEAIELFRYTNSNIKDVDILLMSQIIDTIDSISLISIIYGIIDNNTTMLRILNLSANQLIFLDAHPNKFINKFKVIVLRCATRLEQYESLLKKTESSPFINNLFFFVLSEIMVSYISSYIQNLKQNISGESNIPQLIIDVVENLSFTYEKQNLKNEFSPNAIHIDLLIKFIKCLSNIDLDILYFDPFEQLGVPKDASYQTITISLVNKLKTDRTNPVLLKIKTLIGNPTGFATYNDKIDKMDKSIEYILKILQYFITKRLDNIIHRFPILQNLYSYVWNNLFIFIDEYMNYLCNNMIYKNRIDYFLQIIYRLNNFELDDEQLIVDILNYMHEPKNESFFNEFINIFNHQTELLCEKILNMYQIHRISDDNPEKEALELKKTEIDARLTAAFPPKSE
jgi:hypothetical protein